MSRLFLWFSSSVAILSALISLSTPWLTFYPLSFASGYFAGAALKGPPVTLGLLRCFSQACDVFKSSSTQASSTPPDIAKALGKSDITQRIYYGTGTFATFR